LSSAALLLGVLALATIGPFAQSILFAVVLGIPLAVGGLALGARRTGVLAMLAIGSALAINPLIVEIDGVEYIAVGIAIVLAVVGVAMSFGYARQKRSASQYRTL
jgi:hypothetical protein